MEPSDVQATYIYELNVGRKIVSPFPKVKVYASSQVCEDRFKVTPITPFNLVEDGERISHQLWGPHIRQRFLVSNETGKQTYQLERKARRIGP